MGLFEKPDYERDLRDLQQEEKRSGGFDRSKIYWKPQQQKPGVENLIRVLSRKAGSSASWHMRYGRHFVNHGTLSDGRADTETFICMHETYGKPCLACAEYERLRMTDKEAAKRFKVKRFGVFNVLDRKEYADYKKSGGECPSVRLWEAPIKSVWNWLVGLVAAKGRMSNIFDEIAEDGSVKSPGRDIIVVFDSKADPAFMYRLQAADQSPMGTKEEVLYWGDQIIELIPEKMPFCGPVDDDTVHIKMFGSLEERQELRQAMKEAAPATAAATEDDAQEEAEAEAPPAPAPTPEPAKKPAPALAPKKAAPPVQAEAPKAPAPVSAPAPAAAPASNSAQSMRDKIEAIRKKHAMKTAGGK
jgi:hypothetical protein